MQDSFVTNAQPLLQDIATELAFVETHGAASLKHISQSIADLKLLSNPTAYLLPSSLPALQTKVAVWAWRL